MKIIKFSTSWCGPCKILSEVLKQVDLTGVELVEVDAEENAETAAQYKVQSVPVLFFIKDGVVIERINGVVPAERIEEVLGR